MKYVNYCIILKGATQPNIGDTSSLYFYYVKNACYVFAYICRMLKVCVAAMDWATFQHVVLVEHFLNFGGIAMKKKSKKLSLMLAMLIAIGCLLIGDSNALFFLKAQAAYENTYTNTGNQRKDIIEVAKTQIGNTNGLKYRPDGNAWCAAFIVWCARQAGVDSSIIRETGWATADDLGITYYGRNADRTVGITYTPQSGDIIIFDWSSNGYCYKSPASNYGDHVGLVEYVSNGYVYTIEGNSGLSSSSVKRQSYSLSSSEIKGYGVPNYKSQHTHNFTLQNEGAHPHNEYSKCWECGEWSYTGNTKYSDSCDTCFDLNYVDVWVSQGADIYDPELSEGLVGEYYYIWYKICNEKTGALYDSYGSLNYTAKISIYNPDGTELHSCEYDNDNNWISTSINQIGSYRINITVDGDFTASYDEYFTVRSNGIFKFTPQTLDLDLKNKKNGSVELQLEGVFPEGTKAYLDVSNDNISYTRSGGTITVTALKPGKSELIVTAYDSDGTVLCTATAVINIKDPQYTLLYNGNGGSGVPSTQTGGINYTISTLIPEKLGYNFVGWSKNSSATVANYYPGDIITLNTDTTLYAVWESAETIQANSDFNVNIKYSNQEIMYKFMPSSSGTYVVYSTSDKDTKVTLYDSLGNIVLTDDNSGENSNFRLMQNLTVKTTYYFGIKYSNSSNTGTIPVSMGKAYSISYDLNGGVGNVQRQIKDYGKDITLSTTIPTRNGYVFKGWSTSSTSSTIDYISGAKYTLNSGITLYAVWHPNAYKVTFDANGGVCSVSSKTLTYDSDYGTLPVPVKEMYVFKGWYTSITGGIKITPETVVSIASNHTLYAQWEAATITSLELKRMPYKTVYYIGDKFDYTGLLLTATYSDGTVKTIGDESDDFHCYVEAFTYAGEKDVYVVFEGKSVSFTVTLKNVKAINISIETYPKKMSYYIGETFSSEGMTLLVTYNNGKTETVSSGFACSPSTLNTEGTQKVTVTYGGKTATFNVSVTSVKVTELEIVTVPQKTSYKLGDKFDPTGLTMNAENSKGETIVVTDGFVCTPEILDKVGTQVVTVSYGGKSVMITVVVAEAQPDAYTVKFVADGEIIGEASYEVGKAIVKPSDPKKDGYKFIGWTPDVPYAMPAYDLTFTAVFEKSYICPDCGHEILGEDAINAHIAAENATKIRTTVRIKNNPGTKTIKYGEILRLTAITTDMPANANIYWYVDGVKQGEGEIFNVSFENGTKTVEVKIVDSNGNVLKNASGNEIKDTESVTVKGGFFQKIISFFKNLFRMNRTVVQSIFKGTF